MALTVAFAFRVNVQVLTLFPPLEQAPDQMVSRPFEALNVIEVPVANCAEPVLPVVTLIPVGVEVTRSPLRPVTDTVSVAFCPEGVVVGGGSAAVTVADAVRVIPL